MVLAFKKFTTSFGDKYNIYNLKKSKVAHKSRTRLSETDNIIGAWKWEISVAWNNSQNVHADLENQVGFGQSVMTEL